MKKRMNFRPWYLLAFIAIAFAACKKDNNYSNDTRAGIMAFNLIPDLTSVGFTVSNYSLINAPLSYSNYTGSYLPIVSGSGNIQLFGPVADSVIATEPYTFEPKKYYSVFAVGANGNYKNIIVRDNFDSLTQASGNAYVRYINAIPDSAGAVVAITSGGTAIINEPASFGTVSDFKEVTPGDVSFTVVNTEAGIAANRDITLEQNKVYTVLLMGIPGDTDTAKAVQIKYIQNGTVTP